MPGVRVAAPGRRTWARHRSLPLLAVLLLCCAGGAAAAPCTRKADFAVATFTECGLECATRGAAKGPGWRGQPATYAGDAGLCCKCAYVRQGDPFKAVLQLGGASFPVAPAQQRAVQAALLALVPEFWAWRGAQPLSVDSFDLGDEDEAEEDDYGMGPGPGRRLRQRRWQWRRLRDEPGGAVLSDDVSEQWWAAALTYPLPASTTGGVLAYLDAPVQPGASANATASLDAASRSGDLTLALQEAGMEVDNATVLFAGRGVLDIASLLGGATPVEGERGGGGAEGGGGGDWAGEGAPATPAAPPPAPSGSGTTTAVAVSVSLALVAAAAVSAVVWLRRRRARYARWAPAWGPSAADHDAFDAFQRWQASRNAGLPPAASDGNSTKAGDVALSSFADASQRPSS